MSASGKISFYNPEGYKGFDVNVEIPSTDIEDPAPDISIYTIGFQETNHAELATELRRLANYIEYHHNARIFIEFIK